jgi:peptide/nickel transport system ATP-binding protein
MTTQADQTREQPPLLSVRGVSKSFGSSGMGSPSIVRALEDVSFELLSGQVVALVGESGSGKSTLARVITGLAKPDAGEVELDGALMITTKRKPKLAERKQVQMVFQDPFASLNPVHTVGYHIARPLRRHGITSSQEACELRVRELLTSVGLTPADAFVDKHPHELSGGQRQRVVIARALAPQPKLVVADEPTSMLDVSIRMGILNLMLELGRSRGLSYLMITHDLASARYVADVVLVMYAGRIVEQGPVEDVITQAAHPYTRRLVAAVPDARSRLDGRPTPLAVAGASEVRSACAYAARCELAQERCLRELPNPVQLGDAHSVRCHFAGQDRR